jgi:hypothetical protein
VRDQGARLSKADFSEAPLETLPRGWQRRLFDAQGRVDRRAYLVWVASRLRDTLNSHDVYVKRSERWGDVQVELIQPDEWQKLRSQVCRALDLAC